MPKSGPKALDPIKPIPVYSPTPRENRDWAGCSGLLVSRHFLFLQGVASPFFGRLADHLKASGERVTRINFCGGDLLYWGRRKAHRVRGDISSLHEFIDQQFAQQTYTDLVLFGSQRPIHRPAIDFAEKAGIRVHVFEEGYVRPNWLTLERGGVNADSPLPRDPDWYLEVDPALPKHGHGTPVHTDIRVRAMHDIGYHLANSLNPLLFRGYETHRPYTAPTEYAGWIKRFSKLPRHRRRDEQNIEKLITAKTRYFLLPLQLNGDTQITLNSQYGGMRQLIDTVLHSFANEAPDDCHLVIKNHPLDTGLVDYPALIAELERHLGLSGRIAYLETGDLPTLVKHAAGVITVNSTVGMSALAHRCPIIALGTAIYDMPGLTFQGRLHEFWEHHTPPDGGLFQAFRNTVIHTTQVNGDFYTSSGIRMAVANCGRLLEPSSPLENLIARFPLSQHPQRKAEAVR